MKHNMAAILGLFFSETYQLIIASEMYSALEVMWK